ncbi:unnamed protein product [Lasius platythorax]|uniref:Uncharacterized protein n=1 Tax=Lasius platythorax TaxID=488582 RepID=A0AAV2NFX3_9HYME
MENTGRMGKGVDSFGEGWKGSKSDEDSNRGGAGSGFHVLQNSGNQLDCICERRDTTDISEGTFKYPSSISVSIEM